MAAMQTLEIECPICGEVLELSGEDRAELSVGDVIVCESCNAEMEVTKNEGDDFDLDLLGILTTCPNCGEEFDITEEMLANGEHVVECPHCKAKVELEFEDDPDQPHA